MIARKKTPIESPLFHGAAWIWRGVRGRFGLTSRSLGGCFLCRKFFFHHDYRLRRSRPRALQYLVVSILTLFSSPPDVCYLDSCSLVINNFVTPAWSQPRPWHLSSRCKTGYMTSFSEGDHQNELSTKNISLTSRILRFTSMTEWWATPREETMMNARTFVYSCRPEMTKVLFQAGDHLKI